MGLYTVDVNNKVEKTFSYLEDAQKWAKRYKNGQFSISEVSPFTSFPPTYKVEKEIVEQTSPNYDKTIKDIVQLLIDQGYDYLAAVSLLKSAMIEVGELARLRKDKT